MPEKSVTNRHIFKLAIPNIVSNISVPMLGLVDTALMGREENAVQFLSAIALAGAIFSFVYWGFGFLRMGTTGMTAQAVGAGDTRRASLLLGRALLVAMAAAVLVISLQVPISYIGFNLVEGSESATAIARSYFYIRIWAAPATIGLYAFHGWFLGMQNAVIPMVLAIFVNIINMGLNLLFVSYMDLNAEGIAWGTLCAQYAGFFLAVAIFLWKYPAYPRMWGMRALMKWKELRQFFSVNLDIFIRTLCLIFTLAYFVARSGDQGDDMLSANNLLYQLLILTSYVVDGFAFAAESLVGRLWGANQPELIRQAIRKIFLWGFLIGAAFGLTYEVAGAQILGLLTDKPEIVAFALPYIHWLAILSLAGSWAYLWDGVYLGALRSRAMRNTLIISTFVIFLPSTFLFMELWGNDGLWLSMILFMLSRGIIMQLLAGRKIFSTPV